MSTREKQADTDSAPLDLEVVHERILALHDQFLTENRVTTDANRLIADLRTAMDDAKTALFQHKNRIGTQRNDLKLFERARAEYDLYVEGQKASNRAAVPFNYPNPEPMLLSEIEALEEETPALERAVEDAQQRYWVAYGRHLRCDPETVRLSELKPGEIMAEGERVAGNVRGLNEHMLVRAQVASASAEVQARAKEMQKLPVSGVALDVAVVVQQVEKELSRVAQQQCDSDRWLTKHPFAADVMDRRRQGDDLLHRIDQTSCLLAMARKIHALASRDQALAHRHDEDAALLRQAMDSRLQSRDVRSVTHLQGG